MAIWKSGDQGMAQRQDMSHLGTEPIPTLFRRMAIPAIIGQLAILANNFLDRMYVGHIEGWGGESLTAIGLSTPILLFTTAIASLMAGGSPWVAILLGEQKVEQAHRMVGTSLTFLCSISLLLAIAIGLFQEELLAGCGTSPEIMPYAKIYLGIITWGILPTNLTIGMAQFLTGQGMTKLGMRIIGTSVLLNLLLDSLFIFGFGWGLRGAALATTLSMTVSALQVVRHLFFSRHPIQLTTAHLGIDRQWLGVCLGMGFAPFLAMACEALVGLLYNASLSTYGGDVAVGAMAVYYVIGHIIAYLIMGLSMAMQPMISYNFGMRSFERVRQCTHLLITWSVAICSVIWFVMMVAPGGVCRLFTNDAEIATFASRYLRTYFFAGFLTGVPFVCMNTLRFVRQVKQAIGLVVFRRLLLSVPLIWLLPRFGGLPPVQAILMAAPIIDGVSAAVILCLSLRTIHHLQEA